jgi:hypothetical protein
LLLGQKLRLHCCLLLQHLRLSGCQHLQLRIPLHIGLFVGMVAQLGGLRLLVQFSG